MGRMIFDLTDEDRDALEAIRKHRGHRSHAETLRELIRQAASSGLPTPEQQAEMKAVVIAKQALARMPKTRSPKEGVAALNAHLSGVPLAGTFKRPIYQKGQKS